MASLIPNGKQSYITNTGQPLVGGKLYTYAAGTSTPKATFSDQAGLVANPNPVILDARGEAQIFWSGSYKVTLKDALDNTIWTVDNIVENLPGTITSSTGSMITPTGTASQRDTSPQPGYFRYNTDISALEVYTLAGWKTLGMASNLKTINGGSLIGTGDLSLQPTLISGTNISTINGASILNGGDIPLQVPLISGTTIKTVNGASLMGSGDITTNNSGVGGTAVTGNVTLTVSSPAAMTVTPTAPGLYATLPAANTCSKSVATFSFYNAGEYDYGIKDSTGTQIGWVRPKTGAVIGLSDNSTSAGTWATYGLEKFGVTASYSNPSLTNMGTSIVRVAVDGNRTFFAFGNSDCYGIVYDASTQTWGSPVLIRAGVAAGAFLAILSASNQVLVTSCNSTTGFAAVTLTISGTSITVNTSVPVTLAGTFSNIGQMIQVGSSFVVSYGRATTTTALRAITVSGTVPTIGSETTIAATTANPARLYASGSVLRTFVDNMAGGSSCLINPYTVSGTTLTLGTGTSVTISSFSPRIFQIGNGNVIIQASNGNHQAHISSLSGTTETVSTATLGTVPSSIANSAYIAIGNKVVFLSAPAGNTWYANILTDTGGVASAGTQISGTVSGTTFQGIAALFSSGNTAKFAWQCSSGSSSAGTLTFDCSGSSPILSDIKTLNGGSGGQVSYSVFLAQPTDQTRHQSTLIAGTNAISMGNGVSTVYGLQVSANNISKVLLTPMRTTNGIVGASNNDSYFVTQIDGSTTGIAIIRMEMAA